MAPIFQIFPIPFGNRPPRWIPLTEGFKGTVLANFLPAIIHQSNLVKKTTHLVSHSQSFYFKIWLFLLRHAVKCSTVKIQQKVRNISWKMQQRDLPLSCYLQQITLIWRCKQIAEIFYYKLHSTVGAEFFCCHAADGEVERLTSYLILQRRVLAPHCVMQRGDICCMVERADFPLQDTAETCDSTSRFAWHDLVNLYLLCNGVFFENLHRNKTKKIENIINKVSRCDLSILKKKSDIADLAHHLFAHSKQVKY